jgi:hypothetical protein
VDGGAGDGPPPRVEVSDEIRDDVSALVMLLALPAGALAEWVDPYCGHVFAGQLPEIVEAATPIVCRSGWARRLVTADGGGQVLEWIVLVKALAPVAAAVGRHHILKTIQIVKEDGGDGSEDQGQPAPVRTYPVAA